MMEEIFKDIEGFEGLYQVSNYGRVKSLLHGKERILQPAKDKGGYLFVRLYKNGQSKIYKVHRIVTQAFIPNPDNLPCVNHKDEKPSNNHVENLEWCDYCYNLTYGSRIKRVLDKISKPTYQYTLDGELIAEYPSTAEVQRQLGYNQGSISKCCNGKLKTAYGYVWTY